MQVYFVEFEIITLNKGVHIEGFSSLLTNKMA